MDRLYKIFIDPFVQMGMAPDLLVQTLWDGLVAGVLYSLIALGFVLIFKASGVFGLAAGGERLMPRPLVNQPDIILFMATFGLTYFLIGFGELVFGGDPKVMIAAQLGLPKGAIDVKFAGGFVSLQKIDIAATTISEAMMVAAMS